MHEASDISRARQEDTGQRGQGNGTEAGGHGSKKEAVSMDVQRRNCRIMGLTQSVLQVHRPPCPRSLLFWRLGARFTQSPPSIMPPYVDPMHFCPTCSHARQGFVVHKQHVGCTAYHTGCPRPRPRRPAASRHIVGLPTCPNLDCHHVVDYNIARFNVGACSIRLPTIHS